MDYRFKRLFDIFAASIGILIFFPLILFISVLIILDDGKPVLFTQQRIGRNRSPFLIYKFRTMKNGQITATGRWLRKTGLDELLQFINVLRGEMSMAGPRPLTAADLSRLGWGAPQFDWRWQTRPGITGLAQLLGRSGARAALFLDKSYINGSSLTLDLKLILLSFLVNLFGKSKIRKLMRYFS